MFGKKDIHFGIRDEFAMLGLCQPLLNSRAHVAIMRQKRGQSLIGKLGFATVRFLG